MIRTEIFIEGKRLDLYKDISSEFTYNIDDIKDFSARNTNFSKTIIIPGNAINNQLFGNIFEFGSANFYSGSSDNVGYNFNASKSAKCLILVDKIQVFKGIIRLLEIVIDRGSIEYECVVFGELGGLVSAISNKKLEDLDFSAYNELYTKDNITASWDWASGTTGKGYGLYYPLIDYGGLSKNSKNDWHYQAFRPALYVKEYIDKIITNAGYTYESDFFNTALFKRLIIPNNQKSFGKEKVYNFQRRNSSYSYTQADGTSKLFPLPISEITQNYTPNASNTEFTYTGANFTGTYEIDIRLFWDKTTSIPFHFNVLVNGTVVGTHTWESSTSPDPVVFELVADGNIALNTNDVVSFSFSQEDTFADFNLTVQVGQGLVKIKSSALTFVDYVIGDTIDINASSIPKGIFQKDFFASIIKMFNLYVVESTDKEKHLIIAPYIDFYTVTAALYKINDDDLLLIDNSNFLLLEDASANYLDWTYKIDRSKPMRLKPMSELNGRYYEFKYKQDNDYYNEQYFKKFSQGYGDKLEDTGYEFANDKQTAEVIFSSTVLVGYSGQEKIFPTTFKLTNTSNTQSEDRIDHNIRILQAHKVTDVANWHIRNNSGNIDGHLNSYGYAGHLNDPDAPTSDINFGASKQLYFGLATDFPSANLFNGYWSDYVAEITDKDSKLLTCNVRLTDKDIYNLDFSKLIYIDGSLWRLNKVIDYNPMTEDTTKCEFLKVIELTYA